MKPNFEIELLPEAVDFLEKLDAKSREKIYYNVKKSQFVNDKELFKKINECIWEFRTIYNGKVYRLFAFWDRIDGLETLVIATHGASRPSATAIRLKTFFLIISRRNKKRLFFT